MRGERVGNRTARPPRSDAGLTARPPRPDAGLTARTSCPDAALLRHGCSFPRPDTEFFPLFALFPEQSYCIFMGN